jgi:hypothetical protein
LRDSLVAESRNELRSYKGMRANELAGLNQAKQKARIKRAFFTKVASG